MPFVIDLYSDVPRLAEMPKKEDMQPLNEMARANAGDTGKIFPFSKYKIYVFSNDHNPPHFHILCEGWNVSFEIENTGNYKINKKGENISILKYILRNVDDWLDSFSYNVSILTNRQFIMSLWNAIHSEDIKDE